MPEEIVPNSNRYKNEVVRRKESKPDPEKVVKGKVTQKKNFFKRAEESLISENVETVREYLLWDVLIPSIKTIIVDAGKKALDAIFYGDRNREPANIERKHGTSYVRYDRPSYSDRYEHMYDRREGYSQRRRSRFDFTDTVFRVRSDAENVLEYLVDSTMNYGYATVADFYQASGYSPAYTDWHWGWYELSKAVVRQSKDGYVIVLPKPVMIDDE